MNEGQIGILVLFVFPMLFIMLPIHCILYKRSNATGHGKTFFPLLPLRVGFYTWFSLVVLELLVKLEWNDFLIYFNFFLLPLLLIYYLIVYAIICTLMILFKFAKKVLFPQE